VINPLFARAGTATAGVAGEAGALADPLDLGTQSGEPAQEGDLGLGSLSDDQLLTLGLAARMEIWARGFALFQRIWLTSVEFQDADFKDRTEAWLQAQLNYRQGRYEALVEEATATLRDLAKKSLIKAAFSPEEEKLIQSVVTLEAKLAMIDAFRLKTAEEAWAAQQRWDQNFPTTTHSVRLGGRSSFGPSSAAGSAAYPSAYPRGGKP
jgi:hypothetical protein